MSETVPTARTRRRPKLRFRLRSLFAGLLVLAAFLAGWNSNHWYVQRQLDSARSIEQKLVALEKRRVGLIQQLERLQSDEAPWPEVMMANSEVKKTDRQIDSVTEQLRRELPKTFK